MLGRYFFFIQTLCIESRFAMIAYNHVLKSHGHRGSSHFLDGVASIAPVAMAVNDPFDVAGLYQFGDRALLCPVDHFHGFSQAWGDITNIGLAEYRLIIAGAAFTKI